MFATALASPRFVRRTRLGPNEYRRNFHQIDNDVLAAITSAEADRVTPLMSKVYLRLVSAPAEFWEREGVLYFSAGEREGCTIKASKILYELLGVASATAHKALGWMHEQGIIGYFAGKNGAGIRIFINRATRSIGVRAGAAGKKILLFAHGSNEGGHGSSAESAFNDSFAVSEVSDTELVPPAPKNGAELLPVGRAVSTESQQRTPTSNAQAARDEGQPEKTASLPDNIPVAEVVGRLKAELELCVRDIASRAAAQSAAREMERTREWFETKALPKAVRVAQHETYGLLRRLGTNSVHPGQGSVGSEVGRGPCDGATSVPRSMTAEEIQEMAEACVALLEAQGKPIEATLSELSSTGGGWIPPDDATRVLERAWAILRGCT